MKEKMPLEERALRIILWIYIILCLVIAGLNYGYAANASASAATFIAWIWHTYENWIKTLFIIVGGFLTIRIVSASQRSIMRKRNLIGFTVSALVVHIAAPILLHNKEIYFFAMPLPWTTTPLQLLHENSSIYLSRYPIWGAAGITAALIFYVCISIVIVVGTILYGRRWQCSTICLFNGFASEVFAPAFPLVGKKKKVSAKTLKIFSLLRWVFLIVALFFVIWWVFFLAGVPIFSNYQTISTLEIYKYLSAELLMAMFFWVAFIGRGYCYYCPLGTVLSFIGKVANQQIKTDNANCIQCGSCNAACPMSIDIKSRAKDGKPAESMRCVGCGHCVDICPTETLSYSTRFLNSFEVRNGKR